MTPTIANNLKAGELVANTSSFPYQIGKKVYHFETDVKVNWYQAKNNCRKLGGHLLNIESSQEMDAILAVAPSSRYWTSGNCLAELNEWISDSTGELMPYLRWRIGEPNNAYDSEFCLEIVYKNGLNDLSPKGLRNYICEAKFV